MNSLVFYIISALLVVTPIIFSPKSSELFEFPKMLIIYLGAGLLVPFLVLKAKYLFNKNLFLNKTCNKIVRVVFLGLSVFFSIQFLSFLFSIDKQVSFFGYYSRFNGGLLSITAYLIILLTAYLYLKKKHIQQLLKISLFSGLFVSVWGLPSHFGYDLICFFVLKQLNTSCWTNAFIPEERIFSTLGQPNWFGAYLLVLIFISLYFISKNYGLLNKKYKQTNILINTLLFILFSLELFWTKSDAGYIAYVLLVPLFLLLIGRSNKIIKFLKFAIFCIYIVFFALVTKPYFSKIINKQFIKQTPVTKSEQNKSIISKSAQPNSSITSSADIRLLVWEGAWKIGSKHPWLGTGPETFAYSYYTTRPQEHNLTSEWNYVYNKAHNELLNYFANTGFAGLLSYIFMFSSFLFLGFYGFKKKFVDKEFFVFYSSTILAIFITNLFGFSTSVSSLFLFLLAGLCLLYYKKEDDFKIKLEPINFGFISIYILFIFIYLLNYFMADYYFARAKEYKAGQNLAVAYQFIDKAISLRKEPNYLDQQAILAANLAVVYKIQNQTKQSQTLVKQALLSNEITLKISPQNNFYWKTKAKVNYLISAITTNKSSLNSFKQAVSALDKAAKLAPTDPTIPYTKATFIYQQDPETAVMLLKQSLDLKPGYIEAKQMLFELQKNK